MYTIHPNYDGMLAAHLSSLDYDSYVSDTADEIIADSILDDIMPYLSPAAEDEVRKIVLEMAAKRIRKEREEAERERESDEREYREECINEAYWNSF
ncbi:hypothetical protein EZJ17_06475 [Eikenella exigua]|uniref:Uncharacterized protein n=2 Tax=Neisseriaceae TaxID=481 RepID=A0AAX1F866_9NEIS|nr:hypothetical protein A7P94_00125 [Eikenella sp. NML01-A-086]OAM41383.1 hypothetical protein A7Q02_08840 [Eikenella sp. NML97-A-109]QED92287.1 hypothetical protein EZJ17_06475 [Eikenella exigua]